MTLPNNEKKKQRRQKKGEPLNCFLWQVAFMQHFLTYVPHHYSKNCLLPFPPQKNEKLRLNSILEGLFSTLFIANKQFNKTKQPKQGFEEISNTFINKASFLLFSPAFVNLSF